MKCKDRFRIFVSAGQSVPVDEEVVHSFSPMYEDQETLTFDLYASSGKYPGYVTDQGCVKIGVVKVDLSDVMHLPLSGRSVSLSMMFGEVQIRVTAVVQETGKATVAQVRFTEAGQQG
ncbi:hypothetical protein WKI68_10800 [Streptomyces sp. MS1.HAVA.3]|uniref:PilZ domain-containing protein n=1 Tax=Streptomyces caledonius TaxID=3134107 RepID=A0ABU8U1Q8_9ACTN